MRTRQQSFAEWFMSGFWNMFFVLAAVGELFVTLLVMLLDAPPYGAYIPGSATVLFSAAAFFRYTTRTR